VFFKFEVYQVKDGGKGQMSVTGGQEWQGVLAKLPSSTG